MQIPQYWAQVRLRHETGIRHGATVQRWGWSDISQQHAQEHAQKRAEQALDAVLNAPKSRDLPHTFSRIERLREYGLHGNTPIREEVLERRGNTAKTRNSYGSQCLNVENVAIADVDYASPSRATGLPWLSCLLLAGALVYISSQPAVWNMRMWICVIVTALLGLYCLHRLQRWSRDRSTLAKALSPQEAALADIGHFSAKHPDWGLRTYQTPKGLRIIVTHAPMDANAPDLQTLFNGLKVDPLYALLCHKQHCFRARVTGKPWRMDTPPLSHTERRWPVDPEHVAARQQWSADYDLKAQQFAACHFIQQLGNPTLCPEASEFIAWHDEASNALSTRPLA